MAGESSIKNATGVYAAGKLTPPPVEKKKTRKDGRSAYGFTPYASREIHPSTAFKTKLDAISPQVAHTTNTPLDFAPDEFPFVIPANRHDADGEKVTTPEAPKTPEQRSRGRGATMSAPTTPIRAEIDVAITPTSAPFFASPPAKDALAITSSAGEKSRDLSDHERNVLALGGKAIACRPSTSSGYIRLRQAQSRYSADACLLVGNLANDVPEEVLSMSVQVEFEELGKCFACVFSGSRHKGGSRPYAIVQYAYEQDAYVALHLFAGRELWGRPLRVERSQRARS